MTEDVGGSRRISNATLSMSGAVLALALSILAMPMGSAAQQATQVARIGFLYGIPVPPGGAVAFEQALRDLGWVKGQNFTIEYRSADGHLDRLPALAAELVGL